MKLFLGALSIIALSLLGIGLYAINTGRSAEDRMNGAIPGFVGVVLLVIDVIVALVWVVAKA